MNKEFFISSGMGRVKRGMVRMLWGMERIGEGSVKRGRIFRGKYFF